MRKLPNGMSNYEAIVKDNRIYVDKTMYIEKMENLSDRTIMFLRPRKFGKTLFTSTLEYYYDINQREKFDELFKNTYIGKNPTVNKNKYYVLRFNFSGIDSSSEESTIYGFKNEVATSIELFVCRYNLDFYVNKEDEAESILDNLFKAFYIQKPNEKIYIIIDEYDHFANELLGFNTEQFKSLVSRNGKIRKWYEMLKKGTETVVDRIFITGVAPITLDSTTSGFNIARDITKNINFNDMLGFNKEDVKYLMSELEIPEEKQEKLLPVIKTNYDGYIFSNMIQEDMEKYRMYNSNMTLYFLNMYQEENKIPSEFVDVNIISDYSKIEGLIDLNKEPEKIDLLEKIVAGDKIEGILTEKFNSEIKFGYNELVSLLFYLGYLTIKENDFGTLSFGVPNEVIRKIYSEYFLEYIKRKNEIEIVPQRSDIIKEILLEGKIEKLLDLLKTFLKSLSNRDYSKFDEKYIKIIFYSLCKTFPSIFVKSELEVGGGYSDILLVPIEKQEERYGILTEFKYIKKEDYQKNNLLLKQKQEEAAMQLKRYKESEEIKLIPNLRAYSVVVIKDELVIEEI